MTSKGKRRTTLAYLLVAGCVVLAVGLLALMDRDAKPDGAPKLFAAAPASGANATSDMEGVTAPSEGGQERAALDTNTVEADADGASEAPVAARSIIGLSGFVVMSAESAWVDVRKIRQIGAKVRIGDEMKLLPIAVSDGQFELRFFRQEDGSYALPNGSRSIPSVHGKGSVDLFAPRLGDAIGQLRFEDTGHGVQEGGAQITYPFGAEGVNLILKAAEQVRLFTFDAATDAPLDDVDLFRAGTRLQGRRPHASAAGAIAYGLNHGAPIPAVDGPRSRMELEAHVEGYATQRFAADFAATQSVELRLERGATLHATVMGELPDNTFVQVESANPLARAIPSGSGNVTFQNLPSGTLNVSLLVGDGSNVFNSNTARRTELLDMAAVDLVAGGETRVTLHSLGPTPLPRAAVRGWIGVPEAWNPSAGGVPFRLIAIQGQPLQDVELVTGAALASGLTPTLSRLSGDSVVVFPFDAGEIPPGNYVLYLPSVPVAAMLSVPLGGASELGVPMPPPVEHRVRVIDQSTREPVDVTELHVRISRFLDWVPPMTLQKATGASEFVFQTPDTAISIRISGDRNYFGLWNSIGKGRSGLQIMEVTRIGMEPADSGVRPPPGRRIRVR